MEKFSMLRNTNLKIVKDVKNLERERDNLLKSLSDSHVVCNTLKFENLVLIAKNKSFQNDLVDSRNQLSKFSSEKLNNMLHVHKRYSDRSGLGCDKTASLFSNCASTSKIVFFFFVYLFVFFFFKPEKEEEYSSKGKQAGALTLQGKKGKKVYIEPYASYFKPKVVHPPRKLHSQWFVPTCHHCEKVVHI
jgi:hypothetical protein